MWKSLASWRAKSARATEGNISYVLAESGRKDTIELIIVCMREMSGLNCPSSSIRQKMIWHMMMMIMH